MIFIYTLFSIACFATDVISSILIKPCKLTDSKCIDKSVQEVIPLILSGIPSLGIESSDPLFVDKIEGKLSVLKFTFYNTTVIGYKSCKVSDIKVSQDLKKLHYVLNCDQMKMSGKYEISGRLVALPVEGFGDYEIITGKYNVVVDAEVEKYGSPDQPMIGIKTFILICKALSPIKYDFRNLFNGQTDLSEAAHKFAHENWQEVAELVQEPTWYGSMKKVISNVNKYLKTVTLNEIVID